MSDEWGRYTDKRHGPDVWVKAINWFAILAWGLLITLSTLIWQAKPQVETFFDRLLNVKLRKTWDFELAGYAFYLMILLLCLCAIGLFINVRRHHRKDDRFSTSLVLLGGLSAAGILFYLIYF